MNNYRETKPAGNKYQEEQLVLMEQVREVYAAAPFGIAATVVNSLIVFFIMDNVMPYAPLSAWLAALTVVSMIRLGLVLRFNRVSRGLFNAGKWKTIFLSGLTVSGLIWGSVVLLPLPPATLAHHVFLAFVLGGMAAGAASTFSALKEGYAAYSVPALTPLAVRFLTTQDSFHYSMALMTALYGFLLWRISQQHYKVNKTSLFLRFENRSVIERLQNAKENLERMYRSLRAEIDAKLKAEAELRAGREHLEMIVEDRTVDLVRANEQLKAQIEERRHAEQALLESNERLVLAQKAGRVGLFDIDLISGKALWTAQLEELFGLPPGGLGADYTSWAQRMHPEDRPAVEAEFARWMRERRKRVEFEYRFIRSDGQQRWMTAAAEIGYLPDGKPARMTGTTVDSTERKRLEQKIMHMVHHDMLTGLPNRRLFLDIVTIEMAQARRNDRKFALLFLDLDRFKEINDTLGHEAGDELLKEVSRRLRRSIRQSDTAARIGGDEFNILLMDIARTENFSRIAVKIMEALKQPFIISGNELSITASIGISIYPDDSADIDALFRYADIAMYHAKEKGRNSFQFYNPEINIRSIERTRFENYLRQTLQRGELRIHYQPQFIVGTGRITAVEALVRWQHPSLGLLDSKHFIRIAESIGFISAIDKWVLRTACFQLKTWIDQGHTSLCVAVNLSSRIFQDRDIVETVSAVLAETKLPPHQLEIEITESVAMDDIDRTVPILKTLAGKGIGIAIDDFGTGYSSLNYLKKLPIQRLKIDQSFVKDLAVDPDDRAIIKAVTAMAHSMKISVVAEGVETQEQLSFLSEAGCDEAQGYMLRYPLPPEQLWELIVAGKV
jgi:diguanylate cyclase (GGDEF)-like protein/PAS domain S-box-containing protein